MTARAKRDGDEGARLVASVATPDTVGQWLERATERTVGYLREEVDAVQLFARLSPGAITSPPCEEIMRELAALETRIVSGAVFQKASVSRMSAEPSESRQSLERKRRGSSAARHSGRVAPHFRVTAELRAYYRWLQRLFERHGSTRVPRVLAVNSRRVVKSHGPRSGARGGEVPTGSSGELELLAKL